MTGDVLVVRELDVGGRRVRVTINTPQRISESTGIGYLCHVGIEGWAAHPVRLQARSATVPQTVRTALSTVTGRLGIGVDALLGDAHIGTRYRESRVMAG
ncbi:hypothetical protein [Nocardia arthritidis]|uniref:Uncharacterized protein n=1 Tax=Nocardia arthritidis TaxID=228602 RepID=A0A6G9YHE1_9NOCA|nr:hypothetical protein [Nocardia arthritidis]QIS12611.1 hypothetical protein F5544_23765 [Nocardia arthritidis]